MPSLGKACNNSYETILFIVPRNLYHGENIRELFSPGSRKNLRRRQVPIVTGEADMMTCSRLFFPASGSCFGGKIPVAVYGLFLLIPVLLTGLPHGTAMAGGNPAVPSLHYLANDGMRLQAGQTCVVFDFPFSGSFSWCVSPAEEQIRALLDRQAPFESVDLFLFTHDHVDHFDPALVVKALAAHPEAALAGTGLVLKRVREAGADRLPNRLFEARPGECIEWRGVQLFPLTARHARYWDIDPATGQKVIRDDGYVHVAYLVKMKDFSAVHGGDAVQIAFPEKCTVDLLLLDRGVLRATGMEALQALHRRLGAQRTVLMHIGPAEQAALASTALAESGWLTALLERNQLVTLAPAKPGF